MSAALDGTQLTGYTRAMPGPKPKPKELHLAQIGLKVPPPVKTEFEEIMKKESRKEGELARLLFLRGMAAYKRDGRIIEPQTTEQPTMQNTQQNDMLETALLAGRVFEANLDVPGLTYDEAPHESTVEPRVQVEDEVEDALRDHSPNSDIKARRRRTS